MKTASPVVSSIALVVVALSAAACASASKDTDTSVAAYPAPPAAGANATMATPPARADVATPTSGSVAIEERILRVCGDIPEAHFAFDSARVESTAEASLSALARCFSTGPLSGKGMRLVGHADPRGETEYNLALGQRRAGAVASFVQEHGVSAGKLSSTSRGSLDAVGTDESGWARDRRVDVLLAD